MESNRRSRRGLGFPLLQVDEAEQQENALPPPNDHNDGLAPSRSRDGLQQQQQQQQREREYDHNTYNAMAGCVEGNRGIDKPGRSRSVSVILKQMAAGDPITLRGEQWKLTRAVVHLEDSWKGRISPCPMLEHERVRRLFKLRWHLRRLDLLLVHLLMALSLVETPAWCVSNGMCFWSCYPDFSRNWHLNTWTNSLLEGLMLLVLVAIALLDVHVFGKDYWKTSASGRPGVSPAIRFKHTILALYTAVALATSVNHDAHLLAGYCRALLYLSVHRRTMLVVIQLRHILGAVLEIWVLIVLNILMFSWMGMVLFAGMAEGDYVFPDIFEAGWRLFVLFTTTNFPEIMMKALDKVRASLIFFFAFVSLNVFFLAPLSLAFIFNVFRGGQKGIPRMEEEIRAQSTAAAFSLLDDRGTGHVEMSTLGAFLLEVHSLRGLACRELARLQDLIEEAGVRRPEQPSLELQDFQDAVRVMDRSLQHAEWVTEIQWYYPKFYQSPGFRRFTRVVKHRRITLWPGLAGLRKWSVHTVDFVEALLLLISFCTLFIATGYGPASVVHYDWIQIGVVFGFCVTTGINAVVRGWHNCVQRPTFVFNLWVTLISTAVILLAFTSYGFRWGWRVMRAFRVLHLGLFVAFVPNLAFLMRTLLIMTKRAATPASVLLAWGFVMAVLGVQLFGGLVCVPRLADGYQNCSDAVVVSNTYTDTNLSLLNFNDVPTAFVTLFVLFVVNDWYVIVDEFVDTTGTGWARLFFIVNYIMGVAVILNLVVTVVINSFWDEYKNTVIPKSALRNIHDAAAASANPDSEFASTATTAAASTANDDENPSASIGVVGGSGVGNGSSLGSDASRAIPATSRFGSSTESMHRSASTADVTSDGWGGRAGGALVGEGALGGGGGGARVGGEEVGSRAFHMDGGVGAGGGGMGRGGIENRTERGMTDGDQEGMDAERVMTGRASQRRLDVSGIT